MAKLRRLAKLKTIASLPGLDGKRVREQAAVEMLPSGRREEPDPQESEFEARVRRALGTQVAKRVMSLRKKHPSGTVPELVAMDWLERYKIPYTYQAQVYGGWKPGGIVPDFLVYQGGGSTALLINGNYWHGQPERRAKDASDKLRLLGTWHEGAYIQSVVIVWESALLANRDVVMQAALLGLEMGQ